MPNPLTGSTEVGGVAGDRLKSIIQRVERLEDEKKGLNENIKDVYSEAKSAGFDPKVIRVIIARRRKEPNEVEEQDTLLDLYTAAIEGRPVQSDDEESEL